MRAERVLELRELVHGAVEDFVRHELFSLGWWDGYIEDGEISGEEFLKLQELFDVNIIVTQKTAI